MITHMQKRGVPRHLGCLLCYNMLYYCILLHPCEFQLDFVADGDVGALNIYLLALSINLDCPCKKELQPTVPDVQDKPFHPSRASKDKVF